MIVGPILLALAVGLLGSAEHSPFAEWLSAIAPLAWIMPVLGQLVPYAIITIVFTFMYQFIPNTRVEFKAALIGGVTAGIIWALVGKVFTTVILDSSRMMAVYTGFAIVLTTLVWVYLSWLILLIGAELAFYVQFPQYLRHGQAPLELTGCARETAGLSVMYLIGRDYSAGKTRWTAHALAAELDIPSTALEPVLTCLEKADLIIATEKAHFVPGRALTGIPLINVLDAIRTRQSGRLQIGLRSVAAAAHVMTGIDAAIRERLAGRSLGDLIDSD
jgi:membrane protein